jgi:transposase InsO family protein
VDGPTRPRPDDPHDPDRTAGLRADRAALPGRGPGQRAAHPGHRQGPQAAHHAADPAHNTDVLRRWTKERAGTAGQPLFTASRGRALSRDAVALLVSRHAKTANRSCPPRQANLVKRGPVESGQYTSFAFQQVLDDHQVLGSIGSVGDAYDNALAESFVDSFKTELIADRVWSSRSWARWGSSRGVRALRLSGA